ncbi:MAG TPA: BrnT family toxin [Steroidobacteraceae bacterium]|nr:BrnT family toxin [Steroidobacteraceae bacterium]
MTPPKRPRGSRRRRKPLQAASDTQLGLAWYTREAWERLRQLADDVEALDESFEDWERGALSAIRELESVGRSVQKVPVDIDALVAWCRERSRRVDSVARAEYVTYLLQRDEQLGRPGPTRTVRITWDTVKAEANIGKHGVTFAEGSTVLLDPLALTVFDAEHSQTEERWFTLGMSAEGKLLAVSHTYFQSEDSAPAEVRIISAPEATRRERQQYESEPR